MSTTVRGWIDFPPVLQEGGSRGPNGRKPMIDKAFGVLQVVDTETSPAYGHPGAFAAYCSKVFMG